MFEGEVSDESELDQKMAALHSALRGMEVRYIPSLSAPADAEGACRSGPAKAMKGWAEAGLNVEQLSALLETDPTKFKHEANSQFKHKVEQLMAAREKEIREAEEKRAQEEREREIREAEERKLANITTMFGREGGVTFHDLSEGSGLDPDELGDLIKDMVDNGRLRAEQRGRNVVYVTGWQLLSHDQTPFPFLHFGVQLALFFVPITNRAMPSSMVTFGSPSQKLLWPCELSPQVWSTSPCCGAEVFGLEVGAPGRLQYLADHMVHGDGPPRADVQRLSLRVCAGSAAVDRVHHVVDVGEIAGLLPVPEDLRSQALERPVGENAYGHVGALPRAVYCEVAQGYALQAVELVEQAAVHLGRELAGRVRRDRNGEVGLGDRKFPGVAVDR